MSRLHLLSLMLSLLASPLPFGQCYAGQPLAPTTELQQNEACIKAADKQPWNENERMAWEHVCSRKGGISSSDLPTNYKERTKLGRSFLKQLLSDRELKAFLPSDRLTVKGVHFLDGVDLSDVVV